MIAVNSDIRDDATASELSLSKMVRGDMSIFIAIGHYHVSTKVSGETLLRSEQMFRWYWQSEKAIKVYNTGRCDF
jgi:hypothetical protein